MRNKKRKTTTDEAYSLLKSSEYGILSTVNSTNSAYGVPMSFAVIDNTIYFHCAMEGEKLDNISLNPQVCFTVVGKTELIPEKFTTKYESVICTGVATVITGQEKANGLLALIKKYSPDYLESAQLYIEKAAAKTTVFKLEIEKITGKASR